MGQITKAQQEIKQGGKPQSFSDYMKQFTPVFKSVMPKGFTPERLTQMAITARSRTPKLSECDMTSFLSCCLQCASLGLEPSAVDGLGRAYIIPRWNKNTKSYEATFLVGKNGLLELVRRTGQVSSIRTQCVFEGDEFDFYENETGLHFDFKPSLTAPHSYDTFKLVYLVARLKDGGMVFVYMSRNEVDAIRSRSQSKDRSGNPVGPWREDYLAMAEKTIIRRACNRGMLPMSVEMGTALANDDAKPVVLDEEGYEVLANMPNAVPAEVPENVDPETGEIQEESNE